MDQPRGIILLGANGSGKSTLGRELARILTYTWLDVEDYWFYQSDIPYTAIRSPNERNAALFSDMQKSGFFVLSGDVSGWGDEFLPLFELAVLLKASKEVRMKRIDEREFARWGKRVLEDGDMYESQRQFIEFAANRDVTQLKRRALAYRCPLVEMDAEQDYRKLAIDVAAKLSALGQ